MTSILEQKEWETQMSNLGVARFRMHQDKAKDGSRFTDTSAGSRLLRVYLLQVSEEIRDLLNSNQSNSAKKRKMYIKLLHGIDCNKLAMFCMHRIIEAVYKPSAITRVAASIGNMVEDELRFSSFEIQAPEYYNTLIRDLDARRTSQYKHRSRVLKGTMRKRDIEWKVWTNETHVQVGLLLLECTERASDLVQRVNRGNRVYIEPTDEVLDWIVKHDESIEVMLPDRMPCIFPPQRWSNWKDGGFYSDKLQKVTPLVKTRAGQQNDTQSPLLDTACMPTVLKSINALQDTSWRINKNVLSTLKEVWERNLGLGMPRSQPYEIPDCPLPKGVDKETVSPADREKFEDWKAQARTVYTLETQRRSLVLNVTRAIRLASKLESQKLLWLVYQMDFRGRAYAATNAVNPQGSDISKALLEFGEAKPLGQRGWFWFRIHGANKYGNDRGSYEERISWVDENTQHFVNAGLDPIGFSDVWKDADKPYQFLAWCIEMSQAVSGISPPETFKSRLPVALDGSCNGIQHFSALLRDHVGGKSVNLTPGCKPADIYRDVADVVTGKLREIASQPGHEHRSFAHNWLALFDKVSEGAMPRKLAKKPVMTLPYGSTLQTCTQSVYDWYLKQELKFFPEGTAFTHSIFMSKLLWDSIGDVVIASRAAMGWIQKAARELAKVGRPLVYINPIGFPMVQFSPKQNKVRIHGQIGGRLTLQIKQEIPGVDGCKAALGSSPNLVHCIDAAHMHMVVAAGVEEGITHFAMIHDDFGVHACHAERWGEIIREQFVKLHTDTHILADFKEQQELVTGIELPELPEDGTLDLEDVKKSPYFFG